VKQKVYVWPVCIRTFHWLYALSFFLAFATIWFENLLTLHVAFGMVFLVLAIFRMTWGFIGPLYSNFRCFDFQGDHLLNYLLHLFGKKEKTPGHNPASSWGAISMLVLGLFLGVSGVLLYGVQEGRGIAGFLNTAIYYEMDRFFAFHMWVAYAMLAVVAIHIWGVVFEHLYHHTGIIWSMFTGYKYQTHGIDVKLDRKQNLFAGFFLFLSVAVYLYIVEMPENALTKSIYEPIDYEKAHPVLALECGDCHIVFPAYLLPAQSWRLIMDHTDEHFGDELDLDEEDAKTIREYLVAHSADHSSREAAFKILESLKWRYEHVDSIVHTPYWKKTHKRIPSSVFKNKAIDTKFSCDACHPDIVKGMIADDAIRIPGISAKEALKLRVWPKKRDDFNQD
jgi:cytochrome b